MIRVNKAGRAVVVLSEDDVRKPCIYFLELDGWRHLRTDPVSDRKRGKGFGELGMADDLFIRYRHIPAMAAMAWASHGMPSLMSEAGVMWVEFKGPKGKVSPHQREWAIKERARGALVLVSIDDFPPTFEGFVQKYKELGLMCRNFRI